MSSDPNPLATGPTQWRADRCVTHHYACDCREWEHATRIAEMERDVEALACALKKLMALDLRGHQLQDRLQFTTPGREILDECRAALDRVRSS